MASRKTGGTSANAKRPKDSNGAVGHLRGKAKTPWEEITSDGYFYPLSIVYADIHKMTGTLILSHFTYSPLMILRFLQIEGVWQSFIKHVYWNHFPNSICSLQISLSHFGNSHNTSNFFVIVFVMEKHHQWSLRLLLWLGEDSDDSISE